MGKSRRGSQGNHKAITRSCLSQGERQRTVLPSLPSVCIQFLVYILVHMHSLARLWVDMISILYYVCCRIDFGLMGLPVRSRKKSTLPPLPLMVLVSVYRLLNHFIII